jgi:antitoxin (DNA-binding transcriptional repressor) of toxin-antitoxin stability system
MATKMVEIRQASPPLAELVSLALAGTEVILVEGDKPLARLVPVPSNRSRIAGLHAGSMQASDDFDSPLPDTFWTGKP